LNSELQQSGIWKGLATGLDMLWGGNTLRGDGLGFGVPVAQMGDTYYFSSKTRIFSTGSVIQKQFFFNLAGSKNSDGTYSLSSIEITEIGSVLVSYTILIDKVRILVQTEGLSRMVTTLHLYNQLSSDVFSKSMNSNLDLEDHPTYSNKHVNLHCSTTDRQDAAYFYTPRRGLSFGMKCHLEAHLTKSRFESNDRKYASIDYHIGSINPSFYYDVYYDAPQNRYIY